MHFPYDYSNHDYEIFVIRNFVYLKDCKSKKKGLFLIESFYKNITLKE